MPRKIRNVLGALFDIKPVDASGRLIVPANLPAKINLRDKGGAEQIIFEPEHSQPRELAIHGPSQREAERQQLLREIEQTINAVQNPAAELTRVGARLEISSTASRPRYRPVLARPGLRDQFHKNVLSEIERSRSVASAVPRVELAQFQLKPAASHKRMEVGFPLAERDLQSARMGLWLERVKQKSAHTVSFKTTPARPAKRIRWSFVVVAMLVFGGVYGFSLQRTVVNEGTAAVQNLEAAKEHLTNLDFNAASQNFLSAYENFSRAGERLQLVGSTLGTILEGVTGSTTLTSAKNIIEIGRLLADTGQAMSQAAGALAQSSIILNPKTTSQAALAQVLSPISSALAKSDANLKRIEPLLASVDKEFLPEDKRDTFTEFKERFQELKEMIQQGAEYSRFLENLVGVRGTKRYLLLFQNHSELRPTGGFPGSYGVITFENGKLKDLRVDDIYNLDGQLKELIVPPRQMQHITPNWAMRDANWFIDFGASAKKLSSFFRQEAGYGVDGVITVSPKIITDILNIVGPISLPAYGLTLDSDNFLVSIQNEVEYGESKAKLNQPKKILTDFAPLFLDRLAQTSASTWPAVVNALISGLERKDMLFYFRDINLQSFVVEHNFGGQVQETDKDYLMATFSNIKGSKSDAVTDTVLKVTTSISDGAMRHKLFIARTHNGGKTDYGFYNKRSPSFVRVLVPKGSQLVSISGNDQFSSAPLLNYSKTDFDRDEDLVELERSMVLDSKSGAITYEESGKAGFGFWMIVDPGQTKVVELEYIVPQSVVRSDYRLLVQKQPGLELKEFQFEVAQTPGVVISSTEPALHLRADFYTFTGKLERDREFSVTFK